jgi:hypothetical protein
MKIALLLLILAGSVWAAGTYAFQESCQRRARDTQSGNFNHERSEEGLN